LEQFVRDCRITLIYEGTNGIQALDLVGRKLASNGGRAVFSFFAELDDFIGTHEGNADLAPFLEGLKTAKAQLQDGTNWLMQNGMTDFNNAGAASSDYLQLFGLTEERLEAAEPDAIVMHPGPINRGVEMDSQVADGPRSVILQQVSFGIAVRMAVMSMAMQAKVPKVKKA
jgi:hypothetical protein